MQIREANDQDIAFLLTYDRYVDKLEMEHIIERKRIYVIEGQGHFVGWMRYQLFWEEKMRQQGHHNVMTSTVAFENTQHFYYQLGYFAIGGLTLSGESYELILEKRYDVS